VKEKSSPFSEEEGELTVGFTAVAFDGRLSKKLPPLSGGGEVTCGADGAAFGAVTGLAKLPKAEKAEAGCGADDFVAVVFVLGKLKPPKASARPPNASCFAAGVGAIPPNEGCRSC
jgi:hypothetical protein